MMAPDLDTSSSPAAISSEDRGGVSLYPDLHRIVLPDLVGVDVDLNEFRRRDGEGDPGRYEQAVSSANLQPTASITSAVEVILRPTDVPLEPVCHAKRGWSSGNEPLPAMVVTQPRL